MGAEIQLAGPIAVVGSDGVRCHLESGQPQVAFARLLLERDRGTTRDGLADAVWPDQLPPTWGSALRSIVSRLRAFLTTALRLPATQPILLARGGRYLVRLPEDVVVDVESAERSVVAAEEALARGGWEEALRLAAAGADCLRCPFLPGHDGPWVASRRDHMAELLLAALETGSRAAVKLGDTTRALVLAEEAARLAPLRESSHRCRMAAHAASGNRGEALRAYQDIRGLLAEELGVDPAPDTEAAYLDLLGVPPPPGEPAGPAGASSSRATSQVVSFAERPVEMSVITDAWTQALQSHRQLLYITGEVGAGKTRLIKEAGRRIAVDGGLVLFGRCDRDSPISYQPFVEALDGYVAATPSTELSLPIPRARRELAALSPGADDARNRESLRAAPGVESPAIAFEAVKELVASTSHQRPTLLLLDDLHWADRNTLVFLRHLLRHTSDARLLVIGTARDDLEPGQSLVEVTYGLERDGLLSRLPLVGMDTGAIAAVVEQVCPDAPDPMAIAARLHDQTAGNPLMVVELLTCDLVDLRDEWPLPRGIHDLVEAKLAAVPNGEVERLLHAAALIGSTFDLSVAAEAAQLALPVALDALDASLLGLVVEVDPARARAEGVSEYRFRHEVVRRSLAGRLSGARRNHLLRRVAAATGATELATV